jgi:hypothetical protein
MLIIDLIHFKDIHRFNITRPFFFPSIDEIYVNYMVSLVEEIKFTNISLIPSIQKVWPTFKKKSAVYHILQRKFVVSDICYNRICNQFYSNWLIANTIIKEIYSNWLVTCKEITVLNVFKSQLWFIR